VIVTVEGEEYAIVDIGMRMLTKREQFNAQGFPPDYIIDRDARGARSPDRAAGQVRQQRLPAARASDTLFQPRLPLGEGEADGRGA
jgi:hypothetical protein